MHESQVVFQSVVLRLMKLLFCFVCVVAMSMQWRVVAVLVIAVGAAAAGDGAWLYKDPKQPVHVRVHDLLSRMTLAEKIGQMTQIEKIVANSSVIESYYVGQNTFFFTTPSAVSSFPVSSRSK